MALQVQRARVWLFYLKHLRGDRGTLEFKVIQEICAYLTDCLELTEVTRTFLRFFNCLTSAWGPKVYLKTLPTGEEFSTWVILKGGGLLYSGGMTSNSQTGTGAASFARMSWIVMEQWRSCPTCLLLECHTEIAIFPLTGK